MAPGPLPLGVSVVDQSIVVFGVIFPRVAQKHRLQMLEHFSEHLKQHQGNKRGGSVAAAEAIQMNIFTAVLSSLKGLVEAKAKFGQEDVKKAAINLILGKKKYSKAFGSTYIVKKEQVTRTFQNQRPMVVLNF